MNAAEAWLQLRQTGAPLTLDVPVVVTLRPGDSRPSKLVLDVTTEHGDPLGPANVFYGEWFPGAGRGGGFSHYFHALQRTLVGLQRRGDPAKVRLQILKAVDTGRERPYVVLLKFVIAPEWSITGTELEQVYSCPLSGYFQHFIGVGRDVLKEATRPAFTVGNAIHHGYNRTARAVLDGAGDNADQIYLAAVRDSWTDDFAHLLVHPFSRPGQIFEQPVAVRPIIVARCRERWGNQTVELLQERLFFSPSRGLSGKADRVIRRAESTELYEVKTSTFGTPQTDPLTGRKSPGGVQALAYHEIIRTIDGRSPRSLVEEFTAAGFIETRLDDHPVVTRAEADLEDGNDRYVDLLAQSRNVAFVLASGLLTGYDRQRIDGLSRSGQRIRDLGGDFDLYAASPPCRTCPARERRLCEDVRGPAPEPFRGFFRFAPDALYAYWAWFHRQLKQEEVRQRESLYHLASVPAGRLESEEGITLGGLRPVAQDGRRVTLARSRRIETRIREDDRVLVTPNDRPPGELYSIEATVHRVGLDRIEVDVVEPIPAGRYRVDQVGVVGRGDWQVQGLTDFLITATQAPGIAGRPLGLDELPRLAQVVVGVVAPRTSSVPNDTGDVAWATDLNEPQRRALLASLSLTRGEALLVQGPPGTGKTTLIAHIARAMMGRSFWREGVRPVLILANTHRACNEVVAKIAQRFPDLRPYLVRVGRPLAAMEDLVRGQILTERIGLSQAAPEIDLARDGIERLFTLAKEGRFFHEQAGIFVATLAAARAAELRGIAFDTVLVDETGQATEPAALQALRHLPPGYQGRLILIGDHLQLPPVVAEETVAPPLPEELKALGFDEGDGLRTSLFERLARRWPDQVLTLTEQYRMIDPICRLVSETFYEGRLRTGPRPPAPGPWPLTPVTLIDTSTDTLARDAVTRFGADESRDNQREAELVAMMVRAYLWSYPVIERQARASEVGIISAYRKQNNRIRQELEARVGRLADPIRVDTVDRFQGGERDVILVSLVASNETGSIGRLQADWRRLNVAISRPRQRLILVGNRATFELASTPDEETAKERYRVLFDGIDRLAGQGLATISPSQSLDLRQ